MMWMDMMHLLQLLSKMSSDDENFSLLSQVLKSIKVVASYNNEAIRDFESRMLMVHKMMYIVKQTNINVLDTPHRQLLKEGVFKCSR